MEGRLDADRRGSLKLKAGGRVQQAARHLRQPRAAQARRLLRAVDLRLPDPRSRHRWATTSRWPGRSRSSPARTRRSPGRPTGTTTSAAPARWATSTRSSQQGRGASPRTRSSFELEQTFMFYLPRICEHCLNPSCMASCPSGAIYKRAEDGIVLVDQDRCRGWRQCITGCPYKKIYFNHKTGKAEKCTFCYPRDRGGPADGLLGDLRRAAALPRPVPLRRRPGHRGGGRRRTRVTSTRRSWTSCSTPSDPEVVARGPAATASRTTGWTRPGARRSTRSPRRYRVALPLHPEYRTMPMVWYVPPLSPIVDVLADAGPRRRGPRRPVRRDRGAAHPRRVPRRALHRRAHRHRHRRAAASSPRCAPTCAT